MKLIPHLVPKVRKVLRQNDGHGLIIHGVMSLGSFSNFANFENFLTDFSEPKKARKLKVRINMDND